MSTGLLEFAEAQYQAALLQLEAARKLRDHARAVKENPPPVVSPITWVYINRLSELTGLSPDAIRHRVNRGSWMEGIHYRKEVAGKPKSRVIYNLEEISRWLAGKPTSIQVSKSTTTK